MISLRKSMDMQLEEVLHSALTSYRSALTAVGQAGAQACPPVGEELKSSLLNLGQRVSAESSARTIAETEQLVEQELRAWSDRAGHYYDEKTDEVKEILTIVAKAAVQVAERDARYARRFGDLTETLQATAKLNDLTAIRQSLVRSAAELKTCVSTMAKDGEESVAQLRAQMRVYEDRLEEVERVACQDELTGLSNRRKMEHSLEFRTKQGVAFGVLFIDLNGFKQINDTLGHVAGDDLLKQFAGELRTAFPNPDVVGRWGGDEFIVLVDDMVRGGKAGVERIEQWVVGEYAVKTDAGPRKVQVSAATGFTSWQPNDTPAKILQRADAAMYEHKSQMKRTAR